MLVLEVRFITHICTHTYVDIPTKEEQLFWNMCYDCGVLHSVRGATPRKMYCMHVFDSQVG